VTERPGAPPLRPFGLRLHHDGRWSHEGEPIRNRGLREHFDRSVRYLPDERKFVVTLRHFRAEIEVEEAAFFVRTFDAPSGRLTLSDRSEETLEPATLVLSPFDGALLCRTKRDLAPDGLLARFTQSAHAELMQAVEEGEVGLALRIGGSLHPIPRAVSSDQRHARERAEPAEGEDPPPTSRAGRDRAYVERRAHRSAAGRSLAVRSACRVSMRVERNVDAASW
jgi:hypothetical protein